MTKATTPKLRCNPQAGLRPSLEFRPVEQLQIDPAYQRSVGTAASQTLIRKIAIAWDWSLCQPLAVAKRDTGELMVVDGQHRLAAARLRGDIYDLPCVVTSYVSAGAEAAAFVALNQQRRPLGRMDLFKAALAASDVAAGQVMQLVRAAGLSLAPHTNYTAWKPGMISNIAAVQTCYRVHGEKVTAAALLALAEGFDGQVLRYAGTIFPGIFGFIAEEIRIEGAIQAEKLSRTLGSASQAAWVKEILVEVASAGVRRNLAARMVVWRSYKVGRLVQSPGRSIPVSLGSTTRAESTSQLPPSARLFCEQCDRKVSGAEADACSSPFCKAKAKAA